jgi:hypothetical protein
MDKQSTHPAAITAGMQATLSAAPCAKHPKSDCTVYEATAPPALLEAGLLLQEQLELIRTSTTTASSTARILALPRQASA